MVYDADIFSRVNTDVLLQIFEELRRGRGLRSLSMTCRRMRDETLPVLFRSCLVAATEPINAERFLPQFLWPYVCSLCLEDHCPDLSAVRRREKRHKLRFANDRLLCGIMDPIFLKATLSSMPRLRFVKLALYCREIHGIGWDTLATILSTPQLRSFTLQTYLFSPRQCPGVTDVDCLTPITTFQYAQPAIFRELHQYPTQKAALSVVISKIRHTLECLLLPSEAAPFETLADHQWPRLRQLYIRGEVQWNHPDYHLPPVTLFAGMPKLRILRLHLSLRRDVDKQILQLWPKDHDAEFPWPDLGDLTVSFPSPEDQIYYHLPQSLRRLSLRCFPHHCFYLWETKRLTHLDFPLLYASEMLEIVTKIDAPYLDYLQLEYRADAAEDDLLNFMARKFPRLTFLEVHQFHSPRAGNVTVHDIASRAADFHHLVTLRANLDFEDIAISWSETPNDTEIIEALEKTAAALASKLACQNVKLWLLQRLSHGAAWVLIHLEQDRDRGLQVEIDPGSDGGKERMTALQL